MQSVTAPFLIGWFALLLAACVEGRRAVPLPPGPETGVLFSWPADGLEDVLPETRIFATLGGPDGATAAVYLALQNEAGEDVAGRPSALPVPGGRALHFTPGEPLVAGALYKLVLRYPRHEEIRSTFRVRRAAIPAADGFRVVRLWPSGKRPFMDHSSIRLLFSEPLDATTIRPGEGFSLQGPDGEVPGRLLVRGSRLTFDPADDLEPGRTYTVRLSAAIRGLSGRALAPSAFTVVPVSSGVTTRLALPAGAGGLSELTGEATGEGVMDSFMAGRLPFRVSGTMTGELGNLRDHPRRTPVVIRRGHRLEAGSVPIRLGGRLDTGLDSGPVTITLISDAHGFMEPPATGGGAEVLLYADLAIGAEDPVVHGLLSQQIMHVPLAGRARVDGTDMVISLEADLPLDIAGVERGYGRFSTSVRTPARPVEDDAGAPAAPMQLAGETGSVRSSGDGLRMFFTAPPDPLDLLRPGAVRLYRDGQRRDPEIIIDGGMVRVLPGGEFPAGDDWLLEVDPVRGPDGAISPPLTTAVSTAPAPAAGLEPLLTSVYPGVPCVLRDGDWQRGGEQAGRCLAHPLAPPGAEPEQEIFSLPRGRHVQLMFSEPPLAAGLGVATTCVDESAALGLFRYTVQDGRLRCEQALPARAVIAGERVTLIPSLPLRSGPDYRYFLRIRAGAAAGCAAGGVCGARSGLPLRTAVLSPVDGQTGRPDILIPFRVVPARPGILLSARSGQAENTLALAFDSSREVPWAGMIEAAAFAGPARVPFTAGMITELTEDRENNTMLLRLMPSLIRAAGIRLQANALTTGAPLFDLEVDSGPLICRTTGVREFVLEEDDDGLTVSGHLELLMDAPHLQLMAGEVRLKDDLHSRRVSVPFRGRIAFGEGGRVGMELTNTAAVRLPVSVRLGRDLGQIFMEIPDGALQVDVSHQR